MKSPKAKKFPVSREELEQHYMLMANVTNTPPEELVREVPLAKRAHHDFAAQSD